MTPAIRQGLERLFPALVQRSTAARDLLWHLSDHLRAHAIAHEDVRRLCADHVGCDAYMTAHLARVRGDALALAGARLVAFVWRHWESLPVMPDDLAAAYARCAPIALGLFGDDEAIAACGGRRALPAMDRRVGIANRILAVLGPSFGFRLSSAAAPHVLTPMEHADVLGLSGSASRRGRSSGSGRKGAAT